MPSSTDQKITVRSAQSKDLDAVALVWHESAGSIQGIVSLPAKHELRDRIDRELVAGWELHVAERNHRVVGMLAIKPHEAAVDQIFVLTSEQGKGVGSSLLNFAKQVMPNGFTLRMAEANHRAAAFYDHAGLEFVESGKHPVSGAPVRFYRWNEGGRTSHRR